MTNEQLMSRVLVLAVESRKLGNHPFGALLAVDGKIISEAHNAVDTDSDVTAHAEMMLIRTLESSGQLEKLAAGTVFASCEPCPMCVGALFWAGARDVVYGLSHKRLNELVRVPFSDGYGFEISAERIGSTALPKMSFDGPHREDEAALAHQGFWHSDV